MEETLKKVMAELEKDPDAVPPPCTHTKDRAKVEQAKAWNVKPRQQKLDNLDWTIVSQLKWRVRKGREAKEAVQDFDSVRVFLTTHKVVDALCLEHFEAALRKDDPEQRMEFIIEEEKRLRKSILAFGFEPTVPDPWNRAWQYMHYQALVKVRNEFEGLMSLYTDLD